MTEYDLSSPEDLQVAGIRASYLEYLHGCPICSGSHLSHYCRVPSLFRPEEFIRYERCSGCGTVFRNPRLPSDYRESRYEDLPAPEGALQLKPENQMHYRYMMRLISRFIPDGQRTAYRLLDFGCGSGGFLVEAQQAGYDVMGLELNKSLAAHVTEKYGVPTYQGLITDPEFANERFQIILSSQVFEHLVDPKATLLELREHLLEPGLVLIEVPNLRHIKERLHRGAVMDDSHLFYFSASSLPDLLRRTGFEILKIQEGIRPYRFAGSYTSRLPDWLHEVGMSAASAIQIKTGLSVLARLAR